MKIFSHLKVVFQLFRKEKIIVDLNILHTFSKIHKLGDKKGKYFARVREISLEFVVDTISLLFSYQQKTVTLENYQDISSKPSSFKTTIFNNFI